MFVDLEVIVFTLGVAYGLVPSSAQDVRKKIVRSHGVAETAEIDADGTVSLSVNAERGSLQEFLPQQTLFETDAEMSTSKANSSSFFVCAIEGGICICPDGVVTFGYEDGSDWLQLRVDGSVVCGSEEFYGSTAETAHAQLVSQYFAGPNTGHHAPALGRCRCFSLNWCDANRESVGEVFRDNPHRRRNTIGAVGSNFNQRRRWCGWGPLDCSLTEWADWTPCQTAGNCSAGMRTRNRTVLHASEDSGSCGHLLEIEHCLACSTPGPTPLPTTSQPTPLPTPQPTQAVPKFPVLPNSSSNASSFIDCAKEGHMCGCNDGVVLHGHSNSGQWLSKRVEKDIFCNASEFAGEDGEGDGSSSSSDKAVGQCRCFNLDWCGSASSFKNRSSVDSAHRRREASGTRGQNLWQRRRWCGLGPRDCIFAKWSTWSACKGALSCGTGHQSRTRAQVSEAENGGSCGDKNETRKCNLGKCIGIKPELAKKPKIFFGGKKNHSQTEPEEVTLSKNTSKTRTSKESNTQRRRRRRRSGAPRPAPEKNPAGEEEDKEPRTPKPTATEEEDKGPD